MGKHEVGRHVRNGTVVDPYLRTDQGQQPTAASGRAATAARSSALQEAESTIDESAARRDVARSTSALVHEVLVERDVPWPPSDDEVAEVAWGLNKKRLRCLADSCPGADVDGLIEQRDHCVDLLLTKAYTREVDADGRDGKEISHLCGFVEQHWDGVWHSSAGELRRRYVDVMADMHKSVAALIVDKHQVAYDSEAGRYEIADLEAARALVANAAGAEYRGSMAVDALEPPIEFDPIDADDIAADLAQRIADHQDAQWFNGLLQEAYERWGSEMNEYDHGWFITERAQKRWREQEGIPFSYLGLVVPDEYKDRDLGSELDGRITRHLELLACDRVCAAAAEDDPTD